MKLAKHCLKMQREVKSKSGFQENHQRISPFKFYSQQIPATCSQLVSILTSADVCKDNCAPKRSVLFLFAFSETLQLFLIKTSPKFIFGKRSCFKNCRSCSCQDFWLTERSQACLQYISAGFFLQSVFAYMQLFKSLSRLINICLHV